MMMLKYSLFVFCFLLAGYSCVPGHKETKTSAKVETTCTDSICAGPGDISPEGTASDCISFAHADSIDADSIYTSPSQKNESASTLVPKHQKSPMALYMDSLGLINIAELDNSIAISLMYTKADNFTGEILYDGRHQHSGLAGATVAYGHKGRSSWSRSAHHRRRRTDTQRKNHRNRTSEPDIIEESNESRRIPCIAQRMVAFQLLQPRRSPEEIQRNTINKSTI